MATIVECLQRAAELQSISDSARLDVELLLCRALDCQRTTLFAWPEKELSKPELESFDALLQQRLSGRPVAHLLGEREFWSLPLDVDESTLIPRPDTEVLVEAVLDLALPSDSKVLDLGTGTGAIALALASENPGWSLSAVDFSEAAVSLARRNRKKCGLDNVSVYQSDWFSSVADTGFHAIVSNPPYIDERDPHLSEGDVRFEPLSALVAGDSGFSDLQRIAEQARDYLISGGWLLMEHGFEQGKGLRERLRLLGYQSVATRRDYGGNERITCGRWGG